MLTVAEAEQIILQHAFSPRSEEVELTQSLGRVLGEDLVADRDFPPFDRVAMDGIAIRYTQFAAGRRHFAIAGIQAAGQARLALTDPAGCLEVATGAVLPEGADTVVRYEDLRLEDGAATVLIETIKPSQNIHFQGTDRCTGNIILQKGRKIGPAEIAVAATVGKTHLRVARLPETAIVATGDELVAVGQTPLPHQIRSSNALAIQALLSEQCRLGSRIFHLPDDEKALNDGLAQIFDQFELVILSGAVSAGKFDFVPRVLESLGVEKCFHQVSQRPGKPFWFGRLPGKAVVFALPGNPVSAFLCACRYILPFVRLGLGQTPQATETAALTEPVTFKPALTYFLPVRLASSPDGRLLARPSPGGGSGDLAKLVEADGFLELPLERDVFEADEAFPLYRYRF